MGDFPDIFQLCLITGVYIFFPTWALAQWLELADLKGLRLLWRRWALFPHASPGPLWGQTTDGKWNDMKKHTASKRRVSFMQNHQFWEFLFCGEILRQVTPLFWGGAGWMGVLVQKRFFRIPWIEIILQAMHMKKMAKLCGEIQSWLSHPPSVNHFAFGNHAHQFLLTFQLKTELLHICIYNSVDIRSVQWFQEPDGKFYFSEILLGLEYLHSQQVCIWRWYDYDGSENGSLE